MTEEIPEVLAQYEDEGPSPDDLVGEPVEDDGLSDEEASD